jgi:transposase
MAYSLDLREKIVRAYDEERGSQRAVAELFGVSRSFVEKLLARRRATGEIAALPHGGGRRPRCDAEDMARVQLLVEEQADATLEELRERAQREHNLEVSRSTMSRLLQRLGLPRKKSRSTLRSATRPAWKRRAVITTR